LKLPEHQRLSVLKALVDEPNLTQRELADKADLSLGRTNYVLKALVQKGCVKLENFTRSDNKLGYLYLLTPKGLEEKVSLTRSFLARKHAEFDALQVEIKALEAELEGEK
jgi:EPS-associated MarR family transcriptional regulator